MHIIHVLFCLAISMSFLNPSLKISVSMCFLYPPLLYPPSSFPSQMYSTPCLGSQTSIFSRLKCSTLDVGKLRISTRALISFSFSRSVKVSIERLLWPIVHMVVFFSWVLFFVKSLISSSLAEFQVFVGFCSVFETVVYFLVIFSKFFNFLFDLACGLFVYDYAFYEISYLFHL